MFRTKVYKVICKQTANEYILGRISGIMYALAGATPDKAKKRCGYANTRDNDMEMMIFRVNTTKLRYGLMRKHIEAAYPGLCVFEKI